VQDLETTFNTTASALKEQTDFNTRVEKTMEEDKKFKEALLAHVDDIEHQVREMPSKIQITAQQVGRRAAVIEVQWHHVEPHALSDLCLPRHVRSSWSTRPGQRRSGRRR
jgi:hypothetical protein